MSFFVLGLPRSRTAWLANFLTYDGHFCYHEAVNGCSSVGEYREKIANCGDSTTNVLMFDYEREFPDSKIVIIHSDINRSIEFGERVFKADMTELMGRSNERLSTINGLHIMFEDINERLGDIWRYLFGVDMDKKRAEFLTSLNVQIKDVFDIDADAIKKLNKEVSLCHS